MKTKTVVLTAILAAFSVFALGNTAPKSQSQPQSRESAMAATAMTSCMGHRSMMSSGMMSHHHSAQKLIDRLTADLSAAKSEATSTALRSKLADASSVVAQLRDELPRSGMGMHSMMMRMQNCPPNMTQQH